MDGGFIFFILIVVVGVIVFNAHQSKQAHAAWDAAAKTLGLLHEPGGMLQKRKMRGKVDGFFVTVQIITRGSGKSSRMYTRYEAQFPSSLRLGLNLKREGFLGGMAKAFGSQDIQVGDPALDQQVMIKGNQAAEVLCFLTGERRLWVRRLIDEFRDIEINDAGIVVESGGQESLAPVLIRTVRRLLEAAHVLCDPSMVPDEQRMPGTPIVRPVATPRGMPKPPPLPVADAGPVTSSAPVKEETEIAKPVAGTRQRIGQAAVAVAEDAGTPVSAADVGARLFGGNRGTGEIEREFAAEFAGRVVTGEGLLRHWRKASYDFVFGSGSYLMASVELPRAVESVGEPRSFEVILKLPADTPEPQVGKTVEFSGRLVKVDGLMRRVYVAS